VALLTGHLQGVAAALLGLAAADIEVDRPLGELGIDSVTAVEMVEGVGRDLGLTLQGTLLFDHPTLDALARHLLEQIARPG
jgi:acyl carrier protein